MPVARPCDGRSLLRALRSATGALARDVEEINSLNVYPVPDGDTGSNMLATMMAALEEAERVPGLGLDQVAHAASHGALMGARGNSGVILSQVLRGIADGLDGRQRASPADLASALESGAAAAYRAVAIPVEGTMLTVVRAAAEAATRAAGTGAERAALLASTREAAGRALASTPDLLPVLREAGVVDAGGAGLVRLLDGATQSGGALSGRARRVTARSPVRRASPDVARAYGYETMFILEPSAGRSLDVAAIRSALGAIGESVLVVGDSRAVKVHVHSNTPDEAIRFGLDRGTLSRISVTNLDDEARETRERRAAEFTSSTQEAVSPRDLGAVAVAAGDGLATLFRSVGCDGIVMGGPGANPSIGELLAAVRDANARHVILLPNNRNVLAAARHVERSADGAVTVIPTRNAAEGLAAMLALDGAASLRDNAAGMVRAAGAVQSLQVVAAVRDAVVGGRQVARGQLMVLDPDDVLVTVGSDDRDAILAAIAALQPGFELVTLYYGGEVDAAAAGTLAGGLGDDLPNLDLQVLRGGQHSPRYLIAAE